jgi:hypothetical protein
VSAPRTARVRDPRRRAIPRDESVDVAAPRRQIERHHHGAERPQILDPRRLLEEGREIIVGQHHDRVLRYVVREDYRVGPRLVRLVRDAVESGEIEHVPRRRRHDPIETARLHGMDKAIEVAKALGQRRAREGIGGR